MLITVSVCVSVCGGWWQVALHLVQENRTRFELALECGNIEIALEAATALGDQECWQRLGAAALAQGNHQVVEMCYQRVKAFEQLSFLYAITGNTDKLSKMGVVAQRRGDLHARFHTALLQGDAEERVAVLEAAGLQKLAYISARVHGLDGQANALAAGLGGT